MWCLIRLFRVPWTARRSNQSILKDINPEYSLEGLKLKLKLQYFGHLMRRTDSFEKTLGKDWRERFWQRLKAEEGDDRGWDGWMASPTQWTWVWVNSGNWWLTGKPGVLQLMGLQRVRHNWATNTFTFWAFFGIVFFGIGMKTDLFQSCGHCGVFQICWHIECSTFTASSFRFQIAQLEFRHLH